MLEKMWGEKPSLTVGGILNWFNHSGNQYGDPLEKLIYNHI